MNDWRNREQSGSGVLAEAALGALGLACLIVGSWVLAWIAGGAQ